MKYNFDVLHERRRTDSIKWRYYNEDVLPMWVADMDFLSPEPVIRALRERAEHGIFGYPEGTSGDPRELWDLREVIIDRLSSLYRWKVQPEELVILPGVARGFNLACHAMAEPGGRVVVETPVYPPFLQAPGNAGLDLVQVELQSNHNGVYQIDWDAFEQAISAGPRLFLLCNPHNPVGRVFRQDELERMAAICLREGVVICSDEIHCDLLFSGNRHIPLASLDPQISQSTITLMAPTKTFNLAGLEFSVCIIQNPELRRKMRQAQKGLVGWVNIMGLTAALAAYRDGQEWLDQVLIYLETNRDYLFDFVREEMPQIDMVKPEGTYLAWLDCRKAGLEENPYKHFLQNARVATVDGAAFGDGGEGFVRLNFGCPRFILESGLTKMRDSLLAFLTK
jgi:cysteine-S-conjugate beta-lyase